MLRIIRQLRGRSLSELRFRGTQALAAQAERLRLALGPEPVYRADRVAPEALLLSIDQTLAMLGGVAQQPDEIVSGLARLDPAALTLVRDRTRQLHAGVVQILGLPALAVGSIPQWHREPVSGVAAPKVHWSKVRYLDVNVVGDHKSLWELNRHQYLLAPALSWLADGSDADFQLVQKHLTSWLHENPPSIGVNWASSLEVAYRAIAWCWLLWLLQRAPWNQSLLSRLGDALLRSGLHVERNLSVYFSPNTHLTGEALSLFYLALLLPRSGYTDRWRAKGASILEGWLTRQVYPDGVYTEQAALYQRYTAEIYLQYSRLAQACGQPVSAALTRSLHAQFDVLRSMASADARLPMVGDDDGGQLLPLDQRSPELLAGVLLAGATALNRPELMPSQPCFPALSYALCGVAHTNRMMDNSVPPSEPTWRSRYFPDGGVAVLRDDWSADAAVAVIDAGPHGVLSGSHAHADALSMTLSLGAQPLFIDRGTLTYVGAERNEFRSTASHNTLEFDGESSVTPLGPFQWGPRPARPAGGLSVYERVTLFRAQASGHPESPRPSMHQRAIAHAPRGAWLVLDAGERPGSKRVVVRWQLAAGLTVTARDQLLEIREGGGQLLAELAMLGVRSLVQSVRQVSCQYGHGTAAVVIEAQAESAGQVVTLIVPAGGPGGGSRLRASREPGASICEWTDSGGRHQLWAPEAAGAPLHTRGGVSAVAQALWLTAPASQVAAGALEPELVVALGASRLGVGSHELLAARAPDSAVGDVVAGWGGTHWAILSPLDPANYSESH